MADKATTTTPTAGDSTEPTGAGRTKEPFGRGMSLRITFNDQITDETRSAIVARVVGSVTGDTNIARRVFRGEPNDNSQTWQTALTGYIWPEGSGPVSRSVSIAADAPELAAVKAAASAAGVSAVEAIALLTDEQKNALLRAMFGPKPAKVKVPKAPEAPAAPQAPTAP